jgi:hypothetical protein
MVLELLGDGTLLEEEITRGVTLKVSFVSRPFLLCLLLAVMR